MGLPVAGLPQFLQREDGAYVPQAAGPGRTLVGEEVGHTREDVACVGVLDCGRDHLGTLSEPDQQKLANVSAVLQSVQT